MSGFGGFDDFIYDDGSDHGNHSHDTHGADSHGNEHLWSPDHPHHPDHHTHGDVHEEHTGTNHFREMIEKLFNNNEHGHGIEGEFEHFEHEAHEDEALKELFKEERRRKFAQQQALEEEQTWHELQEQQRAATTRQQELDELLRNNETSLTESSILPEKSTDKKPHGGANITDPLPVTSEATKITDVTKEASHAHDLIVPTSSVELSPIDFSNQATSGVEPKETHTLNKIPEIHDLLKEVKIYELPVAHNINGTEMIEHPIVAFEFAGNWYVAPKEVDGRIPKNPESWSLVVSEVGHSHTRFYHDPNSVELRKTHLETVDKIGSGLTAKQKAGTLKEINFVESGVRKPLPGNLSRIIWKKENEGAGFHPEKKQPLHDFLEKYGLDPFELTQKEITDANIVTFATPSAEHTARLNRERLSVYGMTGRAFKAGGLGAVLGEPHENVFYAISPHEENEMQRLKVGFDEILKPDGTRVHQPGVKKTTVPLVKAMKEIGTKVELVHAPEDISHYMQTGNVDSLSSYARTHMARDYARRQQNHDFFSYSLPLHQTTTHHLMGEELVGKDLTNQTWYRVIRPSDYVAEGPGHLAGENSLAISEAGDRIFNSKRADYFLVRQHPDYTAAIKSNNIFSYDGPDQQLVFLKGDPAGLRPAKIELVNLRSDFGMSTTLELHKRGITMDTNLLKIGRDEYAELWNQSGLNQYINEGELSSQTNFVLQESPLKHYKLGTDHILGAPIQCDAAGKLTGDVAGLCENGLYKLGDDHFLQISEDSLSKKEARKFNLTIHEKNASGSIRSVREYCPLGGEFEYRIADLIKEKGTLKQATEAEVVNLAEHLQQVAKGSDTEAVYANNSLSNLLHNNKPKLPEEVASRIQQAAVGRLDSTYTVLRNIQSSNKNTNSTGAVRETTKPAKVAESASSTSKPEPVNPIQQNVLAVEPTISRDAEPLVQALENQAGHTYMVQEALQDLEREVPKTEGAFTHFMKNEKWFGKKGAVFAVIAGAAIGAVYAASKLSSSKSKEEPQKPWIDQFQSPPHNAQPSASL